jgi:hypothetical protein
VPDEFAGEGEGGRVAGTRQFRCRPVQHEAAAEMGADTGCRAAAAFGGEASGRAR